jgi:hypothetical protein
VAIVIDRRQFLVRAACVLGAAVSPSVAAAVVRGLSAPRSPDRSVLSEPQRQLVARLSELVIPTTDTPGAIEAGVPAFIDQIVSEWYTAAERTIFLDGLAALEAESRTRHAQPFLECSEPEQVALLEWAQAQAPAPETGMTAMFHPLLAEDAPFFPKLRELTVVGYYTSRVGAAQELAYVAMPGRYDGDYPAARVGRAWSTAD